MGLVVKKKTGKKGLLGLWQIDEKADKYLSEADERPFANGRGVRRALQQSAARLTLSALLGQPGLEIFYDSYGKPFLAGQSCHISISHSHGKVAVIVEKDKPTGIDIELIRPKIIRIAEKFMSEEELASLPHGPQQRQEALFVYWCAKESLYKLYGKKELIFKKDLHIAPFRYEGSGRIRGCITRGSIKNTYDLVYEKAGEYMLAYVTYP